MRITIIGGGLAGSEAALQIASRGVNVLLYEMRLKKLTEVHKTGNFGEIVCSNSFGSKSVEDGRGLLKEELLTLGSFLLKVAYECQVPAGKALAVDRNLFSEKVSRLIKENPFIEICNEEALEINPNELTIIATGPLTSEGFLKYLKELFGLENLFFFDAISPVVTRESLDMSRLFFGARYEQGDDYLNAPLTKEEYTKFYEALVSAETHLPHDFDRKFFEACLPIEEIAKRGFEAMRFGPLTPKGFEGDYYAVVQLRRENIEGTLYEFVGFQTSLTYSEQKRVFSLIPGIENAEFVRFGSIHKNSFIKSSAVLEKTLQTKIFPNVFFAGQISGVEGYVESIGTGLVSGINALRIVKNLPPKELPSNTMLGSLIRFIVDNKLENPQPMRANFGLMPQEYFLLPKIVRKRKFIEDSLSSIKEFLNG